LDDLASLRDLTLRRCYTLESLHGLQSSQLGALEIINCPALLAFEELNVEELYWLKMENVHDDADLSWVASASNLFYLQLYKAASSGASLSIPAAPALVHLEIRGGSGVVDVSSLEAYVDLSYLGVTLAETVEEIQRLPPNVSNVQLISAPRLRRFNGGSQSARNLNLYNVPELTSEGLKVEEFSNLERLTLGRSDSIDDLSGLAELTKLRSVSIFGAPNLRISSLAGCSGVHFFFDSSFSGQFDQSFLDRNTVRIAR
jgi:hypothetical protein